jgi:exonuclease SbcD
MYSSRVGIDPADGRLTHQLTRALLSPRTEASLSGTGPLGRAWKPGLETSYHRESDEGGVGMRLLHTADWHLGRIFYGQHLTEDQAHLLGQFVDLAREVRPGAILVAGDIYDRAVPPPEAVVLLDDVLFRLVLDLKVPVVMVAGNHDSPERLAFASRVLGRQGLHVFGGLAGLPAPVILEDEHGPVAIHAVPYAEPPVAREWLGASGEDDGVRDHDRAMRAVLNRLRLETGPGLPFARNGGLFETVGSTPRSVLITHAFVAGGAVSESERPLSVGGAGTVDPSAFEGWSYVALGHLHRPQTAGADHVRYSGSLYRYSFDEADHAKTVNLVHIDGRGGLRVEGIPLQPRREVRRISGRLADLLSGSNLLSGSAAGGSPDDYLMVTLLDDGPVHDAMGRLREAYANVLHIERAGLLGAAGSGDGPGHDHRRVTDRELFGAFYADVTGSELTAGEGETLDSILEDLTRREREVPV